MISLLLHESNAKPRTSVSNKDIIRMYLGYNWLISQRTAPINTFFARFDFCLCSHQSKLPLYRRAACFINLYSFSRVISTYRPGRYLLDDKYRYRLNHSDIWFITQKFLWCMASLGNKYYKALFYPLILRPCQEVLICHWQWWCYRLLSQ